MTPTKTEEDLLFEIHKDCFYINTKFLKIFGPITALFLTNLLEKHNQCDTINGVFCLTHKEQMRELSLSEHQIRRCKRTLKEKGIISTKMKGIPAKEYYTINQAALINFVA